MVADKHVRWPPKPQLTIVPAPNPPLQTLDPSDYLFKVSLDGVLLEPQSCCESRV